MPILDQLRKPIEKIILKSPLHGLLSDDLALISFTTLESGKQLSFAVAYVKENRIVRALCPRKEKCWKKFSFGSPVALTIRGVSFQGWGEIVKEPDELRREWESILNEKPEMAEKLGLTEKIGGEVDLADLAELLNEFAILRIEISGSR